MSTDLAAQTPNTSLTETQKPLTHVAIVLDRSGSMGGIWEPMKEALTAQIDNLRDKKDQRIRTWLTIFDDRKDDLLEDKELTDVDVATLMKNNGPRGSTALFDALNDTVLKIEEKVDDPNCAFLVIAVTDGYENHSNHTTGDQLRDTLTRLQKTDRWTFVYLGANQDITQVSAQTGIVYANTMSYDSNAQSVHSTAGAASPTTDSMNRYFNSRSRGETATQNFYEPNEGNDTPDQTWKSTDDNEGNH